MFGEIKDVMFIAGELKKIKKDRKERRKRRIEEMRYKKYREKSNSEIDTSEIQFLI